MYKLLECPVQNVATLFCIQNNQLKMIAGDMLPISVLEGDRISRARLNHAMSPNYDCAPGKNVQPSSSKKN